MVLSIIIPVFNVEKYIKKTLDSIFYPNAPISDFEVVIINDGTQDKSMSIVYNYTVDYSNVRVVNQINKGLSCARNVGIDNATGDWIWFVDSDDWIEEQSLAQILPILKTRKEDVLAFRIKEIEEATGKTIIVRNSYNNEEIVSCKGVEMLLNSYEKKIDPTPIQSNIIRKDFILRNKLYFVDGIYHEDKEYAPRMLIHANDVAYVPIVSYCYLRRNSGSITTDISNIIKRAHDILKIYDLHREIEKSLLDTNKKKVMNRSNYGIACFFWSIASKTNLPNWKEEFNMQYYLSQFKSNQIHYLFKDRDFKHFVSQILFRIWPSYSFKHHHRI